MTEYGDGNLGLPVFDVSSTMELYNAPNRDPRANPALLQLVKNLEGENGSRVAPLSGKDLVMELAPLKPRVDDPPAPPQPQVNAITNLYGAPVATPAMPKPSSDLNEVLQRLRAVPQQQQLQQQQSATQSAGGAVPKEALQLFVGNVMSDGSAGQVNLKDFLNLAMKQVGFTTSDGSGQDPIVTCRQNAKYSFIEFRNPEDCTNALNLNGIPFMGSLLKIDRPAKYTGPRGQHKTWQELTGQAKLVTESADPATKAFREIFVGNTPAETTAASLSEFVGGTLIKLGMSRPEGGDNQTLGSPISEIRVNSRFCFLEFRSVEEASNCLNLNGVPFNGSCLNIKRSSKYDSSLGPDPSAFFTWDGVLASWHHGELQVLTSGQPSKVLCVTNMVSAADINDEDQLNDMIEDTMEDCSTYAQVRSVYVDKPTARASVEGGSLGRLFIETESEEDARKVIVALKGRTFDGRNVDVKFYPEDAWKNKSFDAPLETAIVTASGAIDAAKLFARR